MPVTDRQTLENSQQDFRLIDPNTLHAQVAVMEAIIEVKTFSNSKKVHFNVNTAINQIKGAYQPLRTNIGLLVIPWERWNEAPLGQKVSSENILSSFEAETVQVPLYPDKQQKGYFKLSKGLYSKARGAYEYIRRDLAKIDCKCN